MELLHIEMGGKMIEYEIEVITRFTCKACKHFWTISNFSEKEITCPWCKDTQIPEVKL